MDVEGPGDGADGFAFEDELTGEFGLIGAHFPWTPKGHATRHCRLSTLIGPLQDQGVHGILVQKVTISKSLEYLDKPSVDLHNLLIICDFLLFSAFTAL